MKIVSNGIIRNIETNNTNGDDFSLYQKQYLEMHNFDKNNVPESLLVKLKLFTISPIIREYLRAIGDGLSAKNISYCDVCIADVVGTEHSKYVDKSLIEAFSLLNRGDYNAKLAIKNPDYYEKELKEPRIDELDEIILISYGDKFYIRQGNNRVITSKVMYELDFASGMNKEELKSKYTYKVKTSFIPLDMSVAFGITQLAEAINKKEDNKDQFVRCTDPNVYDPIYVANINGVDEELRGNEQISGAIKAVLYKNNDYLITNKTSYLR